MYATSINHGNICVAFCTNNRIAINQNLTIRHV